ncbi:hypothetical protein RNJ44_02037 [Nakaseomyces bracarensis]|uniref:Glucan 1,3-beta-glucosidase n=1 Tax=Nakaseomyces bracarensis TaxID=273131 RepID=A0ABR4NMB9_9SACH
MFDKLKQKFEKLTDNEPPVGTIDIGGEMSWDLVYKYRYNHGVNLGALFVLEKWIYEDVFEHGGDSEFDAIQNYLNNGNSPDQVAQKLKDHYNSYINKIPWDFLQNDAGITAFRVPIGYWHVRNGDLLSGLPFEPHQKVYQLAKPMDFLNDLFNKANERGIGILIDIHGLPGGANGDSHSGFNNGGANFFGNSGYVDKMCNEIIPAIVNDMCKTHMNAIGLQVVNESVFDNNAQGQKKYYKKAIQTVAKIQSGLPVIISDGWWPQQFSDWVKSEKFDLMTVIDSHVYRTFSDSDKSKNADQIIDELPGSVNFNKNDADFMVGEFSGVLDEQTWQKSPGDRNEYVKRFLNKQLEVFENTSSYGWFFWTLQFQWGDGGEWGLVPMFERGGLKKRPANNNFNIDENRVNQLIQDHINYWKDKGGDKFEHWRYEDGLRGAINDIAAFARFGNSRIGRWHSWKTLRRNLYIAQKGDSQYMWEWDQGFDRAIQDFNRY